MQFGGHLPRLPLLALFYKLSASSHIPYLKEAYFKVGPALR